MSKTEGAALAMLRELEWSSFAEGPGDGMGDSGGPMVPACPICAGVDPRHRLAPSFIDSAVGHTKTCRLATLLRGAA